MLALEVEPGTTPTLRAVFHAETLHGPPGTVTHPDPLEAVTGHCGRRFLRHLGRRRPLPVWHPPTPARGSGPSTTPGAALGESTSLVNRAPTARP